MSKRAIDGALVSAAVFLVAFAPAFASNAAGMSPLAVKSSLDGKTTLPSYLYWTATTNAPASSISDVNFLIDGKLRWAEQQAPYVYGSGAIGHEGFLFTSWLTPGEHHFTVSVTETNGTKSSDSVTARVLPAPEPPAALAGAWKRVVTAQDAQKAQPQYGQAPPLGEWKLVFDRVGAWELVPGGPGIVNGYDAEHGIIHVYAPIQMTPPAADNSGYGGVNKFGHHILTSGGTDCTNAGPFGTYNWVVAGATLTLTAIHEGCPDRAAVWEGTWTRTNA
jgi:hypothetical protein